MPILSSAEQWDIDYAAEQLDPIKAAGWYWRSHVAATKGEVLKKVSPT